MTALSRLVERWLNLLLDWGRSGTVFRRLGRGLLAVALVTLAVLIVLLRINYNLSLGPQ